MQKIAVIMHRLILAGILFCISAAVQAQSGKVPPFRILQANGKVFKAEALPLGKPIIIIYFSPECEECIAFMRSFFKRAADFSKASVTMITFLPVEKVAAFVKDYNVNRFANIKAGTEGTGFFCRNYYQIVHMPFVALYDKNGNLIQSYQKEIPLNDLAHKLEKLK